MKKLFCEATLGVGGTDDGIMSRIANTMPNLRELYLTLEPLHKWKGQFNVREGVFQVMEKCIKLESFRIDFTFTSGKAQQKMLAMMFLHLVRKRDDLKELEFTAHNNQTLRFEGDDEPEDAEIMAALQVYKTRPTHMTLDVGNRSYRCKSRRVASTPVLQ